MEQKRIAELIKKWNLGKASPEEQQELENFWEWASQDDTLLNSFSENEKEKIRMTMLVKIKSSINKEVQKNSRTRILEQISWPMRIAATLLIGVVAFWLLYNPIDFNEVHTAYSQHRSITLPDGSCVFLNGNSSVRFKEAWSAEENREVWIEGEGFFDVTHTQNNQKFIVHTNSKVDVQVLGTRFNVKLRRGKTEVMLEQGKVQLNIDQQGVQDTISLKPGDLVTLENLILTKSPVNAVKYASWKERKLYFDETPLFEVAKILEDSYGYHVEFKNKSLKNRKLSGELQSGKGEDILIALRESLQIQIIKEGKKVVFN
jgi:transmembrane sensor